MTGVRKQEEKKKGRKTKGMEKAPVRERVEKQPPLLVHTSPTEGLLEEVTS